MNVHSNKGPQETRFVSENSLEEERKAWSEVTKKMQNAVPFDRSKEESVKNLYEQLKANQQKADEEWAEKFKLRGPKALDEEEVAFLKKKRAEKTKVELDELAEEKKELAGFLSEKSKLIVNEDEQTPVLAKPDVPDVVKKKHTEQKERTNNKN